MKLPVGGVADQLRRKGIHEVPIWSLGMIEAELCASSALMTALHKFCMELSDAHIALLRETGRQSEIRVWRAKLAAALDQSQMTTDRV